MGIILCKKHGRQSFDQVCEHIDGELKEEHYPQTQRLDFWGIVLVCEKCWKDFDIGKFENHSDLTDKDYFEIDDKFDENSLIYKEYEKVYNELNRNLKCWCLQCIAEIKVKTAKREAKCNPFAFYENTLTHQQENIVKELERKLTNKFAFQKSAWLLPNEEKLALYVQEGAFTHPLTITIYYITNEKEQSKIVEFIKAFLDETKLNQAKIKFYEAEVIETWETAQGWKGMKKGEENLLKEIFLNR